MRGDLHVHTDRSGDAHSPIDEVVSAAIARGYEYLALTDHAEDLPMNGVSRKELHAQRKQIERLRDEHPELEILQGVELNIGPEGELDYDQDFRMSLDFCVAAVHSHFDLDRAAQTKRILAAMENPAVNVIGHLSGRMIGKRAGIDLEIEEVLQAAKETHTAIEINAALERLDAAADVIRRGNELGVTFVISTDSHHVQEFDRMQWGALQAQRGFLDRHLVANTWTKKRFLAWVEKKRAG
jgi:DNA polymerase (family 10)